MRLWEYCVMCIFLFYFGTAQKPGRSKRTIIGYYPLCPRHCASCSAVNGCITCRPRMFLLLHRSGMRQTGVCLPSCPAGYVGLWRRDFNKCQKCRVNHCQVCFSRSFCTRCRPPYIAYGGQCVEQCPSGLHYANYTNDCLQKVDCEVGEWSSWSACQRKGETCGFKYGSQTRSREIIQLPSLNGERCPAVTETRECKSLIRSCNDLTHNTSDPPSSKIHRKRKRYEHERHRHRRRHRKRRGRRRRRHHRGERNRRKHHRRRRNIPNKRQRTRLTLEERKQIENILVE